mgnify:CR=1 FL=1
MTDRLYYFLRKITENIIIIDGATFSKFETLSRLLYGIYKWYIFKNLSNIVIILFEDSIAELTFDFELLIFSLRHLELVNLFGIIIFWIWIWKWIFSKNMNQMKKKK